MAPEIAQTSTRDRDRDCDQDRLRILIQQLRVAAYHVLLDSQDTKDLLSQLAQAMRDAKDRKGDEVSARADSLHEALKPAINLLKDADDLDPHSLKESELNKLFDISPRKLVTEALVKGELRERRMILQAREARTNHILVVVAVASAIVAAIAALVGPILLPILQRALGLST